MKFVLEERDTNYIDKINKDIQYGECPPLFVNQIGKRYYIEFECTDIAKANNFVFDMMNSRNEEQLEEVLGIRVNCINYCNGDTKLNELKETLKDFLYKLENM